MGKLSVAMQLLSAVGGSDYMRRVLLRLMEALKSQAIETDTPYDDMVIDIIIDVLKNDTK